MQLWRERLAQAHCYNVALAERMFGRVELRACEETPDLAFAYFGLSQGLPIGVWKSVGHHLAIGGRFGYRFADAVVNLLLNRVMLQIQPYHPGGTTEYT